MSLIKFSDFDSKYFCGKILPELFIDAEVTDGSGRPNGKYTCCNCLRSYRSKFTLWRHLRYICGKEPKFSCKICSKKEYYKTNIAMHIKTKHCDLFKEKCDVFISIEDFYSVK